MKRIFILPIIILFVGCASVTPKGELFKIHEDPGASESVVYFYVPEKEFGSTACIIVTVNEEERGCIGNPGYVKVVLSPGEHSFSFRPDAMIDLGVEMRKFTSSFNGGSVYYLESRKVETQEDKYNALQMSYVNVFGGYTVGWVLVPEEEALKKLSILRDW